MLDVYVRALRSCRSGLLYIIAKLQVDSIINTYQSTFFFSVEIFASYDKEVIYTIFRYKGYASVPTITNWKFWSLLCCSSINSIIYVLSCSRIVTIKTGVSCERDHSIEKSARDWLYK